MAVPRGSAESGNAFATAPPFARGGGDGARRRRHWDATVGAGRPRTEVSVFADSSALVKLYSDEPGNPAVRALDMMIVSHLARVEVPAVLWRKQRMGELSETAARLLTEDFEADYFGEDTGVGVAVVQDSR